MKVLHIVNIPWFSGVAKYAFDMAVCMRRMGFDTEAAAVENSACYRKFSCEFKTIRLCGRSFTGTIAGFRRVMKAGKRYDAVFVHSGSSLSIGFALKKAGRAGRIFRVRAERYPIKRNVFNRFIHRHVELCIAATRKIRNDFIEFGIPHEKAALLYPMVDTSFFSSSPIPDRATIGVVGRLARVKGLFSSLDTLAVLARDIPEVRMIIIGRENQIKYSELKGYARKKGILERVSFKGHLPYEKMPSAMKEASVGLISSLGSEAVSRVTLEWFALGRPVVASSVGCLDEFIDEGKTGFLSMPSSPGSAAEKIKKLLKDESLSAEMGRRAREEAERNFSPEIYMKRFKEFKVK